MNCFPGIVAAFEPVTFPALLLPATKLWINPGLDFTWSFKFTCESTPPLIAVPMTDIVMLLFCVVYKKFNAETISILPFLIGNPSVYTSNLDVARQVVAGGVKSHWIKPEDASMSLL